MQTTTLVIPQLPEGTLRSPNDTDALGLNTSHRAFLTSDFALTWLWGEYQRWQFLKEVQRTNFEGPAENLKDAESTLTVLLKLRLGQEIHPEDHFEISYRLVRGIVDDIQRAKPEDVIKLQDPSELILRRLKEAGGWHSDKIVIDYKKYEDRCTSASVRWQDALTEFGIPDSAEQANQADAM